MMFKSVYLVLLFGLGASQASFCGKHEDVNQIFSLDSKVEVLFFFRKEISAEERDYFYENILMRNSDRGYYARDGVQAVFAVDRAGYEGFGIRFRPDATDEQKRDIKKRLRDSPLIYKTYENIVPNQINDL